MLSRIVVLYKKKIRKQKTTKKQSFSVNSQYYPTLKPLVFSALPKKIKKKKTKKKQHSDDHYWAPKKNSKRKKTLLHIDYGN